MKIKLREIYNEHKKLIIVVSIFAAVIMISFIWTFILVTNHERNSNNNSSYFNEEVDISSSGQSTLVTIPTTTPTRDIDTKHATDYDRSLDDIKDVLKNNKWRGKGLYNVDEGKEYSFTLNKDDIATFSSPYEDEKVLINMKYVKSVIGINNTYRIVCDLSFQDGKYITDSILIVVLDNNNGYEIRCEDFPMFQRFEVNTNE